MRTTIVTICFGVIASCGGSSSRPVTDAGDVDGPGAGIDGSVQVACDNPTPVSFHTDVAPLINHCGAEGCHGGLIGQPLTWPYAQLVNVATNECTDARVIVKPGDPANSYLIQKLVGVNMCKGVRMPKLGGPLSDASVKKIEDWICQGAANN
jgi:hypothetical protein